MSQPKDHYDPTQTDPNYRPQYRGYHGGYAHAEAGGGNKSSLKWIAGIVATIVGGIIIIQLQFFGSEVLQQGKAIARIEERMIYIQNTNRDMGIQYAEFRREITDRISRIERGEVSRSPRER